MTDKAVDTLKVAGTAILAALFGWLTGKTRSEKKEKERRKKLDEEEKALVKKINNTV